MGVDKLRPMPSHQPDDLRGSANIAQLRPGANPEIDRFPSPFPHVIDQLPKFGRVALAGKREIDRDLGMMFTEMVEQPAT